MPSSRALLLQRDTEVRSPPPLPRAPCAPWSIRPFHPALGWELASAGWPLPRVCAIRLNTCDGNGKSAKSARCCIACVASQAWGRAGRRCRARWCLWHSAGTRHQRLHRPGTRGCWPLTSQCSVVCQRCCEQGLPSPLSASLSEPILPTALPLLPFPEANGMDEGRAARRLQGITWAGRWQVPVPGAALGATHFGGGQPRDRKLPLFLLEQACPQEQDGLWGQQGWTAPQRVQ